MGARRLKFIELEHKKITFISPSVHVLFCLLYKHFTRIQKKNCGNRWLAKIWYQHMWKNIVSEHDFSQWRKSLWHTRVYRINKFLASVNAIRTSIQVCFRWTWTCLHLTQLLRIFDKRGHNWCFNLNQNTSIIFDLVAIVTPCLI
jgi:hypothetical protein